MMEKIPCPDCEAEIDYEIGPDESMEDILDTAQLSENRGVKKKSKRWMFYCSWQRMGGGLQLDLKMYFQKTRTMDSESLLDCCNN